MQEARHQGRTRGSCGPGHRDPRHGPGRLGVLKPRCAGHQELATGVRVIASTGSGSGTPPNPPRVPKVHYAARERAKARALGHAEEKREGSPAGRQWSQDPDVGERPPGADTLSEKQQVEVPG